jgi:protein-tyrosine phosphatase
VNQESIKMTKQSYPRHIRFEAVFNFRDLGGYWTRGGQTVAWRRLFRSSELHHMTSHDVIQLKEEIKLRSVIDLRSPRELEPFSLLNEAGAEYYNIPLIDSGNDKENVYQNFSNMGEVYSHLVGHNDGENLYQEFSNMGEVYSYLVGHEEFGRRLVKALEIIAEPDNLPLVFHCSAGKDRTGILTAIVLGILGVTDEDIIEDYTLTAPHMKKLINRWNNDPKALEAFKNLPEYMLEASSESMTLFLSTLKREYGSARGYVEAHGGEVSLIHRLETALLS